MSTIAMTPMHVDDMAIPVMVEPVSSALATDSLVLGELPRSAEAFGPASIVRAFLYFVLQSPNSFRDCDSVHSTCMITRTPSYPTCEEMCRSEMDHIKSAPLTSRIFIVFASFFRFVSLSLRTEFRKLQKWCERRYHSSSENLERLLCGSENLASCS
ncbi:uncharacterized protein EI90DRAFT_3051226 [Cantharellus anzutake]|uniref:uncharacterized protein n=1 Tax=Cantharellus anzutake TaxID=1750568 RepID=UPI001908F549|nr:uncharacterized protein EI90DRAFT_3051226 [Cantharellus anzutake]KAF8334145.1 hypothetical protein EI90DRAFT_3051226 [Cantharellus anzutake]